MLDVLFGYSLIRIRVVQASVMTQVRLGSRDSLRFISEINVRVRVMIMFRPGFV